MSELNDILVVDVVCGAHYLLGEPLHLQQHHFVRDGDTILLLLLDLDLLPQYDLVPRGLQSKSCQHDLVSCDVQHQDVLSHDAPLHDGEPDVRPQIVAQSDSTPPYYGASPKSSPSPYYGTSPKS